MSVHLSTLSFALLVLAAVAYSRQRFVALWAAGTLFFCTTGLATVVIWWPVSPSLAVLILAVGLGGSLAVLALFAIDVIWAPFCLEMTYVTALCWILCPLVVLLNYAGLLLCALCWR